MTKSNNIQKLINSFKVLGLSCKAERIEGSHYNLTVRNTKKGLSVYYTGTIKENATQKECTEFCKEAAKELGAKLK